MKMRTAPEVTGLHKSRPSEAHHVSTHWRQGGHLEQPTKWTVCVRGMQCLANREWIGVMEVQPLPGLARNGRQEMAARGMYGPKGCP